MGDHTLSPFEQLQNALNSDSGYAWSWFCNIAVPLMDSTGMSHAEANKAAAHLFQHIFKIDVTGWKEYRDIVDAPVKTVEHKEVKHIDGDEIDESAIYVNITGFKANSGAEAIAEAIAQLFRTSGYRTKLNIADTTLEPHERSKRSPGPGTMFVVTGVESRWHTDRCGVDEVASGNLDEGDYDPEMGVDMEEEEFGVLDEGLDPCNCTGGECLCGDDLDPGGRDIGDIVAPYLQTTVEAIRDMLNENKAKGPLVLNLKFPSGSPNPLGVLETIREQFIGAKVIADIELDYHDVEATARALREEALAKERKQLIITLDKDDPQPERTVDAIVELIRGASLTPVEETIAGKQWTLDVTMETGKPLVTGIVKPAFALMNPEDRKHAYVVECLDPDAPDGIRMSVQYMDVTHELFDLEAFQKGPFRVVTQENLTAFRHMLVNYFDVKSPVHAIAEDLFYNNTRYLAKFGGKELRQELLTELDFLSIPQAQIPNDLYPAIEFCWKELSSPEYCKVIAEFAAASGEDVTGFVIGETEYLERAIWGSRIKIHPKANRMFVLGLQLTAANSEPVARWMRNMNLA